MTVAVAAPHTNGAPLLNGKAKVEAKFAVLPESYYAACLSDAAKRRKPDDLLTLYPMEAKPGMISMLAGKPAPQSFPITSMQFTIRDPTNSKDITLPLTEAELQTALQYNNPAGLNDLRDCLLELVERQHGRRKNEGWVLTIGSGSQDLLWKAVQALVNRGDTVLVESPVYSGGITVFRGLDCEMVEVETDANGICSSTLRSILENWPASKAKPKVLYTVPYGNNPTGVTTTRERRQEVLTLAREHGFFVLEDDPYFNHYYGPKESRPPSYFALESEQPEVGRVIRFDTVSKIISSGIRVGYACAPEALVKAMTIHTMEVNMQPSTLSQIITLKVIRTMGFDGFDIHLQKIADFYRGKRDIFEVAMQKHLKGLAEWNIPQAGMFYWFKLILREPHEYEGSDEVDDSEVLIRTKAIENNVIALPGTSFLANGGKTAYVRCSFSILSPEQVDEALRRLAEVVREARNARKASS